MSGNDNIIRKIRGLLAKANATANQHEAEAFEAKAAELLAKHAIDAALLADTGDDGDTVVGITWEMSGAYLMVRQMLATALAKVYGVRVLREPNRPGDRSRNTATWLIVGKRRQIDNLRIVFDMMAEQMVTRAVQGSANMTGPPAGVVSWRSSFCKGYVSVISRRLDERVRLREHDEPGIGLVLADADQLNSRYLNDQGIHTRTSKTTYSDARAFKSGGIAAAHADIGNTRLGAPGRRQLGA